MVRRDVWEVWDGMDESFWPIWFEDVDFCRRAASGGLYNPVRTRDRGQSIPVGTPSKKSMGQADNCIGMIAF